MMTLAARKIKAIDSLIDGLSGTPSALHDMLAGKYTGKVMVRYGRPKWIEKVKVAGPSSPIAGTAIRTDRSL